ncbi:DNA repair protein RecN [Listeria monocytogenes]|uniref:DNA repair protein RecN n=2 Tax=Listeria monocytogenes TaxID=1639 RepID=Q8Y7B8_LISMO|nr:DNA repair protein RecN [Listeria monocytogenes]NP_464893.1 DNA repair protein [Listeria monocytogenes EGD-e]EAD3234692.1 DNA repair protein RecN [Listeria monocytogenes CFSAN002202]EAD5035916.1 DNA repair protein RecN [Listeria monocytogenes serotype 1/2a]EAE3701267.1 DNA repair protein RecN [Listeria monocytogenes serotype 1/2c]EAF4500338.1 DNA repair protein RecN [Listeria monocytogenes serotype 4b]EAG9422745.1 DNA repair protein RecN [Listeria monocytogenes CFSAN002184]EAG9459109.1 DN
MLQEMTIKNFAIIESLSLTFQEGMTVLTGETGAGKSIIIDALGLLVGGRGSADFIRHGEERLELQGLFALAEDNLACRNALIENGIDASDDMVVLERSLFRSGKNSCRINGKLVTTVLLRQIGSKLIDIHSQHEHQELMNEEFHLSLLDRFASDKIKPALTKYQTNFKEYQTIEKEWQNWTKNERELAQRLDMLRFQQQEIENADLQAGEEDRLLEQKNILANFEKLNENLQGAYAAIQGEPGGLEFVGEAMRQMETAASIHTDYKAVSEAISSSYYMLEDSMSQIRQSLDQLEFQPEELNQIESRLNDLNQLKRKYGKTIEDIIQYEQEISSEMEKLTDSESHVGHLETKLATLKTELTKQAATLTDIRKKAAVTLEKQIKQELNQLYMEKAIFSVRFEANKMELTELGQDSVVFYMSTNPGEPLKPLAKIASGGELSRMMLALKTIFSRHQGITSIIFDEVDTGVSGRVGQAIAEKIYAVSVGSQVLCISHLPQVAAMANHHYYITKKVQNKRTTTSVTVLKGVEKVEEISRMIAGIEVTELTKQHAKEMIEQAEKVKQTY